MVAAEARRRNVNMMGGFGRGCGGEEKEGERDERVDMCFCRGSGGVPNLKGKNLKFVYVTFANLQRACHLLQPLAYALLLLRLKPNDGTE